jgi:hypothetical protein
MELSEVHKKAQALDTSSIIAIVTSRFVSPRRMETGRAKTTLSVWLLKPFNCID